MSLSKDPGVYPTEKSIWAKTLDQDSVKVVVSGAAQVRLRQRLYMFRTILRNQTKEMLPPNDPEYGTSPYDKYYIKQHEDYLEILRDPIHDLEIL